MTQAPNATSPSTAAEDDWRSVVRSAARKAETDATAEVAQVLAMLVHDVKNSFSFIQSWAEGLGEGGREAARAVVRIRENLVRLRGAARDAVTLLSLSAEPTLSYCRPGDILRDVADAVSAACERRGVRLEVSCEASSRAVLLDRPRVESLVSNLVKNALEATASGGCVRVTAAEALDAPNLRLVVEDTGSGPSVGSPYDRRQGLDHDVSRTGVGLLAARRIAASHGGVVELMPSLPAGTRAEVLIPLGDEERQFQSRYPFCRRLGSESVRGLRAAQHLIDRAAADGSADGGWLLDKVVESELVRVLESSPLTPERLRGPALALLTACGRSRELPASASDIVARICQDAGVPCGEAVCQGLGDRVRSIALGVARGRWSLHAADHIEVAAALLLATGGLVPTRKDALPGSAAEAALGLAAALVAWHMGSSVPHQGVVGQEACSRLLQSLLVFADECGVTNTVN